MDLVHLHLMLNHVPVLGVVFAFVVGVIGFLFKSKAVTRVALGMLVFAAIVAVPVYLTGEPAEEVVDGLAGVSEAVIEQHESAATFSLILAGVTGAFALLALLFGRSLTSKLPGYLVAVTLLAALVATASMLWTANLGGQIRHSEIRTAANGGTSDAERAPSGQKRESREDDDD